MAVRSKRQQLKDKILSFEFDFDSMVGEVFDYQYKNNVLYKEYCDYLDRSPGKINVVEEIPFLPISFFKSHKIVSGEFEEEIVFKSSGTTAGQRSKHFVRDPAIYNGISVHLFEEQFGNLDQYCILALLPNYLEQGESSLVHMVDLFIQKTKNKNSRFFKYDFENLMRTSEKLISQGEKLLIIGVSYALFDLADKWQVDWAGQIVMETGGMKGRKREMLRSELHDFLGKSFNKDKIASEYGMTEMISQLYSQGQGDFSVGKTTRVVPFEINDPLSTEKKNTVARSHIVDLGNLDSCSFIATEDLCRLTSGNSVEILGRMDYSEIRGCNLLYTG